MDLPPLPFWIDQKYEATRLLGKGGGGAALLAKKGKGVVAVKLLNLRLVKNPGRAIQRFKKEFLTLKKLNHPHIGKLLDFGFDPQVDQYYFAGEYIEGHDIRGACAPLCVEEIEKLFVQALQALHYLHTYARAGLRHNDIKTANMLVMKTSGGEPHLKLIDFGLASLAPLEVKGGTASYMSPEQIVLTFPEMQADEKFPKPDHRTDLYSLGVAWYFCLTGMNPFLIDRDTQGTLKRHFDYSPVPPSTLRPEIPAYLDKIILKLMKKDPDERYADAAEVLQELRFLSGKPYSVIPTMLRQYYLPEGEWIGQSQAWRPLKESWDQMLAAPAPTPCVLYIVGKPGQGKTKILEHFKNYVQSHEGRMLLLKEKTKKALEEWEGDLRRFTREATQPLVMAVDEATKNHPALKYLKNLRGKTPPARWLLVLTTSDETEVRESFGFKTQTLFLKNFNTEDLRELVKKISPHKETLPPENFTQKLQDHTDGNPRHVTALLQALVEKGLLWDNAGAWHPVLFKEVGIDFGKIPTPKVLQADLLKKWGALSKKKKEILKWLSCFESGALSADLTSLVPKLQPADLNNLTASPILVADNRQRLTFKNSFFQRMVYASLGRAEKQKCHTALAQLFTQQKRPPHQTALHLSRTGKKEICLEALETLALFYVQSGRIEEAIQAREGQLKLLAKDSLHKQLEVTIWLLRLLNRHRSWSEGENLTNAWLKKLPKGKTFCGWRAALLREKGMLYLQQHKLAQTRECFEKALSLIEKDKRHVKEQLILKNSIARTWLDEKMLEKAIAIYQETREAAKKLKPKEALEVLNNDLGYAHLLGQNCEPALRCLQEDLVLFEKAQDKVRGLRAHYLMATVFRRLTRDFNAAIKHYQISAEAAKNVKDNDWLMRIYNGLAGAYLDSAQEGGQKNAYAQALQFFEESLALCHYLKKDGAALDFETAAIYLNIGTVHRELGHFSKAYDSFKTILSVLEAKKELHPSDSTRLCETYIALADCLFAEKKYSEMEEPLQKAWKIAKASKDLLENRLAIQLLWAELAQFKKNAGECREHLAYVEHLQTKYKIRPTPMAQKRLEELKKGF